MHLAHAGVNAVPVFGDAHSCNAVYREGDRQALVATVRDLGVIDETALTWEQAREVRRDREMLEHLRRLAHWLDATMVGKSYAFVQDDIAVRMDTVQDLLAAVEETERKTRGSTDWLGGIDVHHCFFEGIHEAQDGTWEIYRGS